MKTYIVESLAVHKRSFKIEAEDGFTAIMEVFQALENKKMKNGDPLPEEVFDMGIPFRVWPVWEVDTSTGQTKASTVSTLSSL